MAKSKEKAKAKEKKSKKESKKPKEVKESKKAKEAKGKKDTKQEKVETKQEKVVARLKQKYYEEIIPTMMKEFGYANKMQIPKLEKIVVNMGVGKALENKRRLECAVKDMTTITGQHPIITKAKKSVAGFKVREGQNIGCKVTLRRDRMYEFLDRIISIVFPRIRDFRGFSKKSFDVRGNFSLGLQDQSVFPEINLDKMEFHQGMDITFVFINGGKKESYELLKLFGFPFKR